MHACQPPVLQLESFLKTRRTGKPLLLLFLQLPLRGSDFQRSTLICLEIQHDIPLGDLGLWRLRPPREVEVYRPEDGEEWCTERRL